VRARKCAAQIELVANILRVIENRPSGAFPGERFLASALVGLPRNHPARLTGTQVRAWHDERRLRVPFAPLACRVPGFHRTDPFMRLLFTIGVNGVIVQHYFRPSSSHSRPARPEFSPARRPRPRPERPARPTQASGSSAWHLTTTSRGRELEHIPVERARLFPHFVGGG